MGLDLQNRSAYFRWPRSLGYATHLARSEPLDSGPLETGRQMRLRSSSFLPMTMRWISDVPSPMRSSGASR
jgi:hypothetical protein